MTDVTTKAAPATALLLQWAEEAKRYHLTEAERRLPASEWNARDEMRRQLREMCERHVSELRAALAGADAPGPAAGDDWISVETKWPACEQMLLVAFADGDVSSAWRLYSQTQLIWSMCKTNVPITHWRPLPPAPRGESEKGKVTP